jgi:hypothetical protein
MNNAVPEIMITMPDGETKAATINESFRKKWQAISSDEFLYRYLLGNTPLKAYDDGLPDEEHKVLKYFGIKYWEPGMEEVLFKGKTYKAVIGYEL